MLTCLTPLKADNIDENTKILAQKLGISKNDANDRSDDKNVPKINLPPPIAIREIDLHGNTAEEAISTTEQFIRECYQDNVRRIRLIHGKGIFVLQKAIRDYLGNNKLIKHDSISSADKDHGGEGATEADLVEISMKDKLG